MAHTCSPPPWAAGLNEAQRQAVCHDGGPLLVVAGAGTGKTRMLVSRLARLLDGGVVPERVLLVTFSRRAAAELLRRAGAMTDPEAARRVHAGTFHAVAHQLLRRWGAAVGLGDAFSVLDQGDAHELMRLARAEILAACGAGTRPRFPRSETVLAVYGRVVSAQEPLEAVVTREFPFVADHVGALRAIFSAYTKRKRAQRLLDFEDLLLYWRAAVTDSAVGPVHAGAYDHVLVDEYQDTSVVQADILRGLRAEDRRITVVGDDAQAIYGFRAATVRNILEFTDHFPDATVVTLEQNYRSTGPILSLANAIMARAGAGFHKRLWTAESGGGRPMLATCPDPRAEADAVCQTILEHYEAGIALREQAVLFRSAHHSDLLEVALRQRRIPFVKFGGLRFLESAHVRDLLAALRVMDNGRDELAWSRVLQMAEGVGPATAARIMQALGVHGEAGGGEPLDVFCCDPAGTGAPTRATSDLAALADALDVCRRDGLPAGAQVQRLRQAFEPMVRRRYSRPEPRLADLDALARLAAGSPSRQRLVADLTLDPPLSTGDLAGRPSLDDDWLTLSTVHSAKGGEWIVVHVIHATEGAFPADLATRDADGVDEERRLFYVALTRARRHLHLYAPLRYYHGDPTGWGDRHSWAQRTRFLPGDLDRLLEHRAVRSPGADATAGVPSIPLSDTVDRALGELW